MMEGYIRMLPIPGYPEADELLPLDIEEMKRGFFTLLSQLQRLNFFPVDFERFDRLYLVGEAVCIPAGDIR